MDSDFINLLPDLMYDSSSLTDCKFNEDNFISFMRVLPNEIYLVTNNKDILNVNVINQSVSINKEFEFKETNYIYDIDTYFFIYF